MKEVILAKSAGFCFGVERAMDTVYAEADKKNVYTYGPIIHNTEVVNELESKGVKAVNDISEIPEPEKSTVIIRSHGVSKAVYESIKNSGAKIVDASTGEKKEISCGKTEDALFYEMTDMERAVESGDETEMYLNYTKDVMDIMTGLRREWGLKYPEEM